MKLQYGGGITSKSLSEIPDNIKSMISKNYKKIAIVDMNMELKTTGRHDLDNATYIPLNLDFKPSIIIATASWREYNRVGSVCSTTTPVNTDAAGQLSDRYVGMKISGISKQGFTIRSWGEYALRLLEQVIAIE